MKVNKGFSLATKDGAIVSIAETNEPDKAILSISRGDHTEYVSLTKEEYDAIMDLHYSVTFLKKKEEVANV